jgi:hypothetical protein
MAEGTNIFSSEPGQVVAIELASPPVIFAVDGDQELFNELTAIVTSVGIQGQSGYQFMHALREFIYVYVFTERVGEIVINGLAFPSSCNNMGIQGPIGPQCAYGQSGLEQVLTWYECNRITSRSTPITIAFGGDVAYEAFLVSCKAELANPETGIAQFTMRFNFIPNISDSDDFCFPLEEDGGCLDSPCTDMVHLADDKLEELNDD